MNKTISRDEEEFARKVSKAVKGHQAEMMDEEEFERQLREELEAEEREAELQNHTNHTTKFKPTSPR
jgi:hypothetical protein